MATPPIQNLGKWRSIEFECVFNSESDLEAFEDFVESNTKYRKFIDIKEDGSIDPDHEDRQACGSCEGCVDYDDCVTNPPTEHVAKEIVVTYCSGKEKIVRDVCKFLRKRAYVNKSCGTHVHFDMRHVDANMVRLFGARLACCVPALKQILPKSRRANSFCSEDMNEFEGDRYAFINLVAYNDHETLEVRGHSGTLDADKILNWIKICEKIMFTNRTVSTKNAKDLIKLYKFRKKLAAFVNKRYRQVNTRGAERAEV